MPTKRDGLALGIKRAREKHGYTQKKLADKLGIAVQTVANWEQGTAKPEYDRLYAIRDLFDCDFDFLFGRIGEKTHDEEFIHNHTGLSNQSISNLNFFYTTDGDECSYLRTLNRLIEDKEQTLQAIVAYLYFFKQPEYRYKITDNGLIISRKIDNSEDLNKRAMKDILIESVALSLAEIDDAVLFEEALYNRATTALRNLKQKIKKEMEAIEDGECQ